MRKILFAAAAGMFCLTSCDHVATVAGSSTTSDAQVQKNLDASHKISKAFETGDVSGLDSVVDHDMIDHAGEHGDVKGIDSMKAMIAKMRATCTNAKMETVQEAANGDYTFSWMHFTGSSNGSMGMPAGPYDMHSVEVVKYKDGKATEHWAFMDPADMMKMMPPPDMSHTPMDPKAKK